MPRRREYLLLQEDGRFRFHPAEHGLQGTWKTIFQAMTKRARMYSLGLRKQWHRIWWTLCQHFRSLALTVWELWCFQNFEEKYCLLTDWMNYKAFCRTAPATQGMLNIVENLSIYTKQKQKLYLYIYLYKWVGSVRIDCFPKLCKNGFGLDLIVDN